MRPPLSSRDVDGVAAHLGGRQREGGRNHIAEVERNADVRGLHDQVDQPQRVLDLGREGQRLFVQRLGVQRRLYAGGGEHQFVADHSRFLGQRGAAEAQPRFGQRPIAAAAL